MAKVNITALIELYKPNGFISFVYTVMAYYLHCVRISFQ